MYNLQKKQIVKILRCGNWVSLYTDAVVSQDLGISMIKKILYHLGAVVRKSDLAVVVVSYYQWKVKGLLCIHDDFLFGGTEFFV